MRDSLGIAGAVARRFLDNKITPLLALTGLLLGIVAVLVTPREEEPQIEVTFANVFVAFPGASATEVEHLVSTPAEQVFSEIEGIEHVYSVSRPGLAVLTVQYEVGEDRTDAIVRLYNEVFSNRDWLPEHLGVKQPIVKPKDIDDVPIVTLTLWSDEQRYGAYELQKVAHAVEAELKRVPGTRDIYTKGGPDNVVHVLLDPQAMAGYHITVADLRDALQVANVSRDAGAVVKDNREIEVDAGTFLSRTDEIAALVVGMHDGGPVYLSDVATVRRKPDDPRRYAWFGTGAAAGDKGITAAGRFPAVTVAVAKKPGASAVEVAGAVIDRFDRLRGAFVPDDVSMTVTRNYGETANDKAMTLIKKLVFATAAVVLLVLVSLGWREAFIVGTAVVITLAVTLFASWAWGFTLNRVSLFALIFSIGILVDDAIVVVENIHRHWRMSRRSLAEAIPRAVDEVGGPTILATFTVIAALLPMAFVTGLMGPYMSPIPINASTGMLVSLMVAFVVTPWLTHQVLRRHSAAGKHRGHGDSETTYRFFDQLTGPFLRGARAPRRRRLLLAGIVLLIAAALALAAAGLVIFKMLPFDDKSEFQVVVDMPEGTSLEHTARVLSAMGAYIETVPEVTDYQAYAGTASPINFNGLMRQYYLRRDTHQGDLQVNLIDKHQRGRKSHDIALAVRGPLTRIAARYDANVKIVEVPPGPPVQAPLVAEVYGIDYAGQILVAERIREIFEGTGGVVDVDDSIEAPAARWIIEVDRPKAARLGVSQQAVADAVAAVMGGEDVTFLHDSSAKYAVPVRMELPMGDKADPHALRDLKVRGRGGLVPLGEFSRIVAATREQAIHHKDLLPVVYVTGDMGGGNDSPLYGMFDIFAKLQDLTVSGGVALEQFFVRQPENPYRYGVKWDGEWQITYETFRDMGLAYLAGIVLIYLLVVAEFRSYLVPLIIMAPIPLTVIGVMPGHALLGAKFTATSMIGMIALAGIIVRNSILLVDFINQEIARGTAFDEAVVRSAAVRARPIILTAVAAMLGAFFILDDPIFKGLAVSLIFGVFISTLLTLVVIPVLYYAVMRRRLSGGVE